MKLIGWCVRCRRMKWVRPQPSWSGTGVVLGTCDDCEEDERG